MLLTGHVADGCGLNVDCPPTYYNKQISRCDTYRPTYKDVWSWNGIDHRREKGCRKYAAKHYGVNE